MDTMLEAGADDMITEEDSFTIYSDPSVYNDVYKALSDAGYEMVESEVQFVPSMEATPSPKDVPKLRRLVDALEDNDDVQNVQTNCAVDLYEEE